MPRMASFNPDQLQLWQHQGPIGYWRSAAGTFACVAGENVWFGPDGEGWVLSYSALFGEQRVTFRWRTHSQAVIEILVVSWPDPQDADDEDDGPPEWWRVHWEACEVTTDLGITAGLRECGCKGFWIVQEPLMWLAPALPSA